MPLSRERQLFEVHCIVLSDRDRAHMPPRVFAGSLLGASSKDPFADSWSAVLGS
jgi:hypothetical protein